jgi:hypothetical protein
MADGDKAWLTQLATALGLIAGLTALVYIAGGGMLAMRLAFYDLPWESVIGELPQSLLVAIALSELLVPVLATTAAFVVIRLLLTEEAAQRVDQLVRLRGKSAPSALDETAADRAGAEADTADAAEDQPAAIRAQAGKRERSHTSRGFAKLVSGARVGARRVVDSTVRNFASIRVEIVVLIVLVPISLVVVGAIALLYRRLHQGDWLNPPGRALFWLGGLVAIWATFAACWRVAQLIYPRSRDATSVPVIATLALLVGVGSMSVWVLYGATQPLPDAKVCAATSGSPATVPGAVSSSRAQKWWLVGETSDRVYLGYPGPSSASPTPSSASSSAPSSTPSPTPQRYITWQRASDIRALLIGGTAASADCPA